MEVAKQSVIGLQLFPVTQKHSSGQVVSAGGEKRVNYKNFHEDVSHRKSGGER